MSAFQKITRPTPSFGSSTDQSSSIVADIDPLSLYTGVWTIEGNNGQWSVQTIGGAALLSVKTFSSLVCNNDAHTTQINQ